MKTLFLLISATLIFTGCATTPMPFEKARPAPSDRVMAYQKTSAHSATITVSRDEGFAGSACYFGVYINQILAARLGPGERAKFFIEPGMMILRGGTDPFGNGLCAGERPRFPEPEIAIRAGEIASFRMIGIIIVRAENN